MFNSSNNDNDSKSNNRYWQLIYLIIYLSTCDFICDALRDFGSNAYKRRSNGWPKHRSNWLECV